MSIFSDAGATSAVNAILELMDKIKDEPPADQLKRIRQKAEEIKDMADKGYW